MKVIRFSELVNTLKVEPESFEDLYLLAMIIWKGDVVSSRSKRRFKASESDVGEQKEVFLRIIVESVEIDKSAERLRVSGKIIEGKPEEFVRLNSYHTINVAAHEQVEIEKQKWKPYIIDRIRQAVAEAKRPKLGVIAMDEEKAICAYIHGYWIEVTSELYSSLSKKMKEKDYGKQKSQYFTDILKIVNGMRADTVIIAGPGFTKDDLKAYIEANRVKIILLWDKGRRCSARHRRCNGCTQGLQDRRCLGERLCAQR